MAENTGKVIQISGPAVDVQFEEATMPAIYQALRVTSEGFNTPVPISVILEVQQHLGEGPRAHGGHGRHQRHGSRNEGHRPWRPDSGASGQRDAGARDQCDRRAGGRARAHRREAAHADSPAGAAVRRAVHARRDVRDRYQGYRPDPAVFEGRQDRPVRRRRAWARPW